MASWASVARIEGTCGVPETGLEVKEGERVAVVDANAIISGLHLEGLAQKFVTIPEVIAEIRDKQARQFLSMLPYTLYTLDPTEESTKQVLRFARETGDVHSLSTNDMKLLALALTLEQRQHGDKHVREHPVQVRTRSKHRRGAAALPGWGHVPNPEDWKVVDAVPENVLANSNGKSRVNAEVQALELTPAPAPADAAAQAAEGSPPAPPLSFADGLAGTFAASLSLSAQAPALGGVLAPAREAPNADDAFFQGAAGQQQQQADVQQDEEEEQEDGDGNDGWATVGKSRNSERRKERKARRWAGSQQQGDEEPAPVTSASSSGPQAAQQAGAAAVAAANASAGSQGVTAGSVPQAAQDGAQSPGTAAAAGEADAAEADGESSGSGSGDDEDEGFYMPDSDEGEGSGEDEEAEAHSEDPTSLAEGTETAASTACLTDAGSALLLNMDSSVLSVTADFAMQNVLMQMGLRLVTRDGRQITRLTRWALRCTSCFFVTKEAGRVFCPKCGNMTLDKVEVSVGPDGAELYGVRKKHVLKGTIYSLPKPRGGRNARNPILSEDVLMMRMKGKSMRKKDAQAMALDPFAPEYGTETWHQAQQARIAMQSGQLMITSWRNNPNERKPQRNSRRK